MEYLLLFARRFMMLWGRYIKTVLFSTGVSHVGYCCFFHYRYNETINASLYWLEMDSIPQQISISKLRNEGKSLIEFYKKYGITPHEVRQLFPRYFILDFETPIQKQIPPEATWNKYSSSEYFSVPWTLNELQPLANRIQKEIFALLYDRLLKKVSINAHVFPQNT